jgi:hypothetical protein
MDGHGHGHGQRRDSLRDGGRQSSEHMRRRLLSVCDRGDAVPHDEPVPLKGSSFQKGNDCFSRARRRRSNPRFAREIVAVDRA